MTALLMRKDIASEKSHSPCRAGTKTRHMQKKQEGFLMKQASSLEKFETRETERKQKAGKIGNTLVKKGKEQNIIST